MSELSSLADLLAAFELEPVGEGRFVGQNAPNGRDVIFGGQLLAQTIAAATATQPGKEVKTVHAIFARGGDMRSPVDIDIDTMHSGRSFGSTTVTIRQGDRLCARSLVLLHAPEPDTIRHSAELPDVAPPDEAAARSYEFAEWQINVVGGVDVSDPDLVGPPELPVWTRFDGAPDALVTNQELLAYATDGFLIGTSMRPHKGVGQGMAHVALSTGVVSHTLTFHEPFSAASWMLMANEVPYAGRGRTYGRAHVFTEDGRLIASFVQDGMVRAISDDAASRPGGAVL
jgi:acyl-CoA thioesterase II